MPAYMGIGFCPQFICEVLDPTTQAWGYKAREIILMLQSFNFNLFAIRSNGSIVPHKIREHYPEIRNYIAIPKEKMRVGLENDDRS
jgi:hypothetical protein